MCEKVTAPAHLCLKIGRGESARSFEIASQSESIAILHSTCELALEHHYEVADVQGGLVVDVVVDGRRQLGGRVDARHGRRRETDR